MNKPGYIVQKDFFGIMLCDIGHDLSDTAVILLILPGRGRNIGKYMDTQNFPEVLETGNDLEFIHRRPLAVKFNELTDILYSCMMPRAGKIQRNRREGKASKDGLRIFLKQDTS